MTSRRIGVPYARADVDVHGYNVECPECGNRFYGPGGVKLQDVDLQVTKEAKSAQLEYAIHYERDHA
jgi:hypothetical protein